MGDTNAFVNALRSRGSSFDDSVPPRYQDYTGFINKQIDLPAKQNDEDYADTIRRGPASRLLDANDAMHDAIQQDPDVEAQTPLDVLIPKMASGTATREEKMRFYSLTGDRL